MELGKQKKYFTDQLGEWHRNVNIRSLPWKEEKDPYRIWLSEIILQQTRAQQGLPYYLRFTEAFPTLQDMAAADDEIAFRLWQGLGYYNRCKNMLATARYIVSELGGVFPDTYDGLLALKGIGPYTAAAIASFAYGLPCAVVDGNVYRVLSRYFGIVTPFDTTEGKKEFAALAGEVLDKKDSPAHNQAIMDLGAIVCTPQKPLCEECPLQKNCFAYNKGVIADLPVRSKKQVVKNRFFNYLLLLHKDEVWVHLRAGKDIWQNLHEFLLIETNNTININELQNNKDYNQFKITGTKPEYAGSHTQRLTHQLIETRFYTLELKKRAVIEGKDGKWVKLNELKKIAFPKTLVSFLEKKLYF